MKIQYNPGEIVLLPETDFEHEVLSQFKESSSFLKYGLSPNEIIGYVIRVDKPKTESREELLTDLFKDVRPKTDFDAKTNEIQSLLDTYEHCVRTQIADANSEKLSPEAFQDALSTTRVKKSQIRKKFIEMIMKNDEEIL